MSKSNRPESVENATDHEGDYDEEFLRRMADKHEGDFKGDVAEALLQESEDNNS